MGYDVGRCRLPLCDMSEPAKQHLYDVMKRYGLIKA